MAELGDRVNNLTFDKKMVGLQIGKKIPYKSDPWWGFCEITHSREHGYGNLRIWNSTKMSQGVPMIGLDEKDIRNTFITSIHEFWDSYLSTILR